MSSNPVKKTEQTITLQFPVNFEGAEHSEITLRRLKGKDIRKLDQFDNETSKTFFIMQELSGWPPEAFDDMDAADFEAVTKVIEGFTGKQGRPSRRA